MEPSVQNKLLRINRYSLIAKCLSILFICFINTAHAEKKYSPSDVYSGTNYANKLIARILTVKGISSMVLPKSRETSVKPMHVYELQASVLGELYHYANNTNRRPPPLVMSTPIKYTPTDVYYVTELIINNLRNIHEDLIGSVSLVKGDYSDKSPSDVYQNLFELYYRVNRLNGKNKVSPNEVYAQILRAKEDLQYSLLTLSKRLKDEEEDKKRLLVTAVYGLHPDGTSIAKKESGKKPVDVLKIAKKVRKKLNVLRSKNKLTKIKIPDISGFSKVKPIDIFLQSQFIIAELNLLKIPLEIASTTNTAKPASKKTPSDVLYEMKHIGYMLDRLINAI